MHFTDLVLVTKADYDCAYVMAPTLPREGIEWAERGALPSLVRAQVNPLGSSTASFDCTGIRSMHVNREPVAPFQIIWTIDLEAVKFEGARFNI